MPFRCSQNSQGLLGPHPSTSMAPTINVTAHHRRCCQPRFPSNAPFDLRRFCEHPSAPLSDIKFHVDLSPPFLVRITLSRYRQQNLLSRARGLAPTSVLSPTTEKQHFFMGPSKALERSRRGYWYRATLGSQADGRIHEYF